MRLGSCPQASILVKYNASHSHSNLYLIPFKILQLDVFTFTAIPFLEEAMEISHDDVAKPFWSDSEAKYIFFGIMKEKIHTHPNVYEIFILIISAGDNNASRILVHIKETPKRTILKQIETSVRLVLMWIITYYASPSRRKVPTKIPHICMIRIDQKQIPPNG